MIASYELLLIAEISPSVVLFLTSVKVKFYNGHASCTFTSSSQVIVNPELRYGGELFRWEQNSQPLITDYFDRTSEFYYIVM